MELDKPNIPINWHRTKLPTGMLAKLNERSDLKGTVQTLGFLTTMLVTGTASFYFWSVENWWGMITALFLHGTITSFFINAVHELIHGTVFKTKWANEFFASLFGFLGIINHKMFWYSHTEHHKYTLHPPDDLEVVVPIYHSTTKYATSFLINIHFYQDFLTNIRYCFGKFTGPWEPVLVPPHASHRKRKVVRASRIMITGHLLITAISLYFGYWIIPIIVTFHGAYGAWLFFLCNNTQHSGLTENINDFRLNCRTFYLNPIARFFYWHMNWHIEHHMYAAVPCYNLRKLHYAIKHELPRISSGLIETWVEIAYIQYRRIHDPNYRFIAQLPDKNGIFQDNKSRIQQIREQTNQRSTSTPSIATKSQRWECTICGFIYNEARGLPEEGIPPGTAWEEIPDDWQCPDCGVSKGEFDMMPLSDDHEVNDEKLDLEAMVAKKNAPAIIIVGSGMAGYALAREIRKHESNQPITLLTKDDGRVYSKPMLSNALGQKKSIHNLTQESASEIGKRLNLTIHTHCEVEKINRTERRVTTPQGIFPYRDLVLAVGANPIHIPVKGSGGGKILNINDLTDFEYFTSQLSGKSRVALLGAGLIGCEFANDLALAGHHVDVIDVASIPLNRLVPHEIGQALQSKLSSLNITWHLNSSLESVDHRDDHLLCLLSSGHQISADIMLSAVGLQPRVDLATSAGLNTNRGIQVDTYLRSSDPHIFALGDCAEISDQVRPYVHPLNLSARALGHTLTGKETAIKYPVMPIIIKTPSYPIIVVPPDSEKEGTWSIEGHTDRLTARFYSPEQHLLGFALGGDACSEKNVLIEEMIHAPQLSA